MNDRTPVYVKVDEYKDIMDIISLTRDKIAEMKAQEDRELAEWAKELEEVEQKISVIDKTLFG